MSTNVKIEMCVNLKENESIDQFKPFKAHCTDAAYDIMAACDNLMIIEGGDTAVIPAGFKMQLEEGYEAQIRSRSGNTLKKKFQVGNAPGTIDCGYTNEVGVIIYNTNKDKIIIKRGDKIAQMVINKLPEVNMEFVNSINKNTERGNNGFGSTGF